MVMWAKPVLDVKVHTGGLNMVRKMLMEGEFWSLLIASN